MSEMHGQIVEMDEASPGSSRERDRRERQIVGWLGELELKTVRRPEDPADTEARILLYARDLAAYPPEDVHRALAGWPGRPDGKGRHFPTWAELVELLVEVGIVAPEHRPFLPAPAVERLDPEAVKRAAQAGHELSAALKAGCRDRNYGRVKAQWEIDAERGR